MTIYIQILAVLGFIVSVYSLYVRHKINTAPSYTPTCDISDRVSCSKAFGSKYSQTMGIPNALAGIFFYLLIFFLPFSQGLMRYMVFIVMPAVLFSIYLAYISYFRQKNFCVVCSISYLINILLAVLVLINRA